MELDQLRSGYFWYVAPFVVCKNHAVHEKKIRPTYPSPWFLRRGGYPIPLPFDGLPQTDEDQWYELKDEDQRVLPPDEWSAVLGCFACGLVGKYRRYEVFSGIVPKVTEGKFHSDAVCYSVPVRCADAHCKSPATLYVETQGATENELLRKLKSNHFGGILACQHNIGNTTDTSSSQLSRIMKRLW